MDRKLAKNAKHMREKAGIYVLLPSQFWTMLQPWIALKNSSRSLV